jgi:protease I
MSESIDGKRVALLVANEGVEQVELTRPWDAVEEAGGEPVLVAPERGEVQAFEHLDKGEAQTQTTTP